MSTPIVLDFEDFKRHSGQHRVYYYEGLNFFDFHFLVDGQIIKTTVMKRDIENMQQFFSHKMFYGATRIYFNIPLPKNSIFDVSGDEIKVSMPMPQDEEVKNEDIQREGSED